MTSTARVALQINLHTACFGYFYSRIGRRRMIAMYKYLFVWNSNLSLPPPSPDVHKNVTQSQGKRENTVTRTVPGTAVKNQT
jgi:hypothetical protein